MKGILLSIGVVFLFVFGLSTVGCMPRKVFQFPGEMKKNWMRGRLADRKNVG